eukprot:6414409-Prymnesium_polylepis.1
MRPPERRGGGGGDGVQYKEGWLGRWGAVTGRVVVVVAVVVVYEYSKGRGGGEVVRSNKTGGGA